MITVALVVIALSLIGYVIKKIRENNQYWERKGVKHMKPLLFFGNCFPMMMNKKSLVTIIQELYEKYPNEEILGFYDFLNPRLFIRDPDLVQKILIKDFNHFTDRGFEVNTEKNPMDDQLFVMTGTRWRAFRNKMSPIFTSGKLKEMYITMTSCGENLLDYLGKRRTEDIDVREVMGLFSMDVIGAAVFGMDPMTLKHPDCEFRRIGRKIIEVNTSNIVRLWFIFAFPNLAKKLGFSFHDQEAVEYYSGLIKKNFEYRKESQVYRNDFTQMLLQLKQKSKIEIHNWDTNDDYLKVEESDEITEEFEITDTIILAQAFSFMVTGFEITALLMMYALFELTQHPGVQQKVREEILEVVKLHGGLTYDALKDMKYLEATIKETQRFYASLPYLFRVCTKDYVLPSGYVIKKGENVAVPINAIHMDPANYPNPIEFKPERFLKPMKKGIYLPFGEGPRICIAMRYALLVMKYGVAKVLMNYRVKLSKNTKVPLEYNYRFFNSFPSKKIYINLEKDNETNV